ncbi:hypothetical protein B7494_g225 [Chlorociboria aeruginascens]|nr:hypothetical protein B7494_g225 [Chlorociboria aeruginascens]
MPAPGEQHLQSGNKTMINPFEDVKPRISEYTAQDIATLQSKLEKQLGPEYISSRAGPSGQKVHYLAAEKCIQLANEVFGFNGWSSQIMDVQVDFVDESPNTLKISLGLSVVVRVTLRDGTFHEDIGYGHIENCKGKAAAFEKAKKEGTTDGLKRALRNFGNVLGNCIYDKEYLAKVTKVKIQPAKWDVENLHRHSTYTLIKKEPEPAKLLDEKSQNTGASLTTEDTVDDEFGDFDDADFSNVDPSSHPDEVVLPAPSMTSRHLTGTRNTNSVPGPGSNGVASDQNRLSVNLGQNMAAPARPQNAAQGQEGARSVFPQGVSQTPNTRFSRSTSGAGLTNTRPPQDSGPPGPAQSVRTVTGRILNQPSRTGPPSAPASPARLNKPSDNSDGPPVDMPPPGAGFFSARGLEMLPPGQIADNVPLNHTHNLPVFNPNAESPSIRKTPGIDHRSSKPTTRDLKHVPGSTQAIGAGLSGQKLNIVNPQFDATRRIGAPGMGSPSPMANRGMYKPPTMMKRPIDSNMGRTPLVDLPANGAMGGGDGGDVKRQRLNE